MDFLHTLSAILLLCALIFPSSIETVKHKKQGQAKQSKSKRNGDNLIWNLEPQVDPVKVGYIREIELIPEFKHHMKTLSLDPPIFEIPGFLTSNECDGLVARAKVEGLEKSPLMDDPDVISSKTSQETFDEWDVDSDGYISASEMMTLPGKRDLYFTEEDIHQMFKDLDIDKDGNGKIDFKEFEEITVRRIKKYFNYVRRKIPRLRSRNSNQAWVWHDDPFDVVIKNLHQRLHKLTKLPIAMLRSSEPLQVVRYLPKGHYHCHHDSDELEEDKPCCVYGNTENCRLCRYITVLYFLNNPLQGGETAFPLADNSTFDDEAWVEQAPRLCNLAKHCHDSNVYVKPEKGKAIMWYNHRRDSQTGWVGDMINLSYHGGCDVIRGVKWIANNWLNVIGWPGSKVAKKGWKNTSEKEMKKAFDKKIEEEDKKLSKLGEKDIEEESENEDWDQINSELPGEADDVMEQEDDGDDGDSHLFSDNAAKYESEIDTPGEEEVTDTQGEGEDEEGDDQSIDLKEETESISETENLNTLGDDYEELDDSYEHSALKDSEEISLRRFNDEL